MKKVHFPIPLLFGMIFLCSGILLSLLLQVTGGEFFFPSFLDRAIYFIYECCSFFLLGTMIGSVFFGLLLLFELLLGKLKSYREARGKWRIAITFFFVVLLFGVFLSINVLIQGGYRFDRTGFVISVLAALTTGWLAGRFHHLFMVDQGRPLKKFHVCAVILSLFILGLTRVFWVSGEDAALRKGGIGGNEHTGAAAGGRSGPVGSIDNVIIILQDALRADHLSFYGYRRKTSPNLDSWAQGRGSIVFENAFTPKTKTSPAVASLFTGLYPQSHGIYYCAQRLRDDLVTIAEVLSSAGFRTASIVGNKNASSQFNYHQGFHHYQSDFASGKPIAQELVDTSINWLEDISGEGRFFLYLHFIDTHTPYEPPAPYDTLFLSDEWSREFSDVTLEVGSSHLESIKDEVVLPGHETDLDFYISMYDAEIRYFDDQIKRLIDYLEKKELLEKTLVIFTSDHGESLTEHNYFFAHGSFTYQPSARIPLVFSHESFGPPKRSDALTTLLDVIPTLLDLLGIDTDMPLQGGSLRDILLEAAPGPDYTYFLGGDRHEWVIIHTVTDGRWKLIYNPAGLSRSGIFSLFNTFYPRYKTEWLRRDPRFRAALLEYQLYDLERDPGEQTNLIMEEAAEADRLKRILFSRFYRPVSDIHGLDVETNTLDERTLENLRALGYIQ